MERETQYWIGHCRGWGIVGRVAVDTGERDHPHPEISAERDVLYAGWDVDLSRASTIFGKSNTVTPLSRSCKFFIRYM